MPRLALRPLTLIAILALMAVVVGAQAPVPTNEDQETAKTVVDLLERGHMARAGDRRRDRRQVVQQFPQGP